MYLLRQNARLSPGLFAIANLFLVAVFLIQMTPAYSEELEELPPRLGTPLAGETAFLPNLDPLGQPWPNQLVRLPDTGRLPVNVNRPELPPDPPASTPVRLQDPPGSNVALAKVWHGLPTQDKVIALTIDDAPIRHTAALLDILREKDVPATFFVDGRRAVGKPALMRQIVAEGHEIANHTWSHPWLTWLDQEQIRHQIRAADYGLRGIDIPVRRFLRPPYGDYNRWVLAICQELDQQVIMWNIDSLDWRLTSADAVLEHSLKQLRPGGIALFHDGPLVTLQAMAMFIDEARARGYRFVLLSEYIK